MRTFLRHALLWITIFVGYTYMGAYYDDYYGAFMGNLVNVPMFIVAYYSLRYVQIPYLYNRGRTVLFVLSFLAISIGLCAICRCMGILWMDDINGKDSEGIPFLTLGAYLLKTGRFYFPAMALLALESHQNQRKEADRIAVLEKEKIATELKFLKAQINPHFLFNTLNNLYSYVVTQSPKAPDMIIHLSGMLDYILYKSQNNLVALKEEIETIEHFLELEKIRYGVRLTVEFEVEGNQSILISPLILLSLVENAFKHGASGDVDQPIIRIHIKEVNGAVQCDISNTKGQHQGELTDEYKEGIGLTNIKRQLDLIYPNQHTLEIQDLDKEFNIAVNIRVAA